MANGNVLKRRGGWWARVWFTDPVSGKRKDIQRRAASKAEAREVVRDLLEQVQASGGSSLVRERTPFCAFAADYEARYLVEPEYRDGKKVSGQRSWADARKRLARLKLFFSDKRLRDIRYADLERYRSERLSSPKANGEQRQIATVNRELALLRRVLNVAVRDGWLRQNPFGAGEGLISAAAEQQRQRILTRDEEARLLAACEMPHRRHLRPLVIAALDTGMRRGELLTLRWRNVDLERGAITVDSINTKTLRSRIVPVTPRLHRELLRLRDNAGEEDLVFGITNTVKNSFGSARAAAELQDLRFHDLRHTAATRLVRGALSLPEVARILGHSQLSTTYRYVNSDEDTVRRAGEILGEYEEKYRL